MKKLFLFTSISLSLILHAEQGFCQADSVNIFELSEITDPPVFAKNQNIYAMDYPKEAQDNEIEGTVYVKFEITASRKIRNVQVIQSSGHKILDNAAVQHVTTIKVSKPGKINGKPVSVWFIAPFKFYLR